MGSRPRLRRYFSPVHNGADYKVVMTATDEQHAQAIEKASKCNAVQSAIKGRVSRAQLIADIRSRFVTASIEGA